MHSRLHFAFSWSQTVTEKCVFYKILCPLGPLPRQYRFKSNHSRGNILRYYRNHCPHYRGITAAVVSITAVNPRLLLYYRCPHYRAGLYSEGLVWLIEVILLLQTASLVQMSISTGSRMASKSSHLYFDMYHKPTIASFFSNGIPLKPFIN